MKTITKNPRDVIPNINETDRYKNLILFETIYHNFKTKKHEIMCIVNLNHYDGQMTLEGNDIRNDSCRSYGWISNNESTIKFITRIWNTWERDIPGIMIHIFIIETRQELIELLSDRKVTAGLTTCMLEKFSEKFQ